MMGIYLCDPITLTSPQSSFSHLMPSDTCTCFGQHNAADVSACPVTISGLIHTMNAKYSDLHSTSQYNCNIKYTYLFVFSPELIKLLMVLAGVHSTHKYYMLAFPQRDFVTAVYRLLQHPSDPGLLHTSFFAGTDLC